MRPLSASSANARENSRSPVAVAMSRPADATTVGRPRRRSARVEHVVVDQRGRVHELDGHGSAHDAVAGRVGARGHQHEQRAQALAAGRDGRAGVRGQELAVPGDDRRQALLDPAHERPDVGTRRAYDSVDRRRGRHYGRSPTWMAMMPPAVNTQRILPRPTDASVPASSSGPGKRRTELGR